MYQGVINRIFEKPGKFGSMWSFTLKGQDPFFGTKGKKPTFPEGTSVQFEANKNAKGYMEADLSTMKEWQDGTTGSAEPVRAVASKATERGYWDRREAREIHNDAGRELGASRNTALSVIDLMIKNEAIKIPATVAKREEFLWELLNKYTNKLMGKTNAGADSVDSGLAHEVSVREPSVPAPIEDWK